MKEDMIALKLRFKAFRQTQIDILANDVYINNDQRIGHQLIIAGCTENMAKLDTMISQVSRG